MCVARRVWCTCCRSPDSFMSHRVCRCRQWTTVLASPLCRLRQHQPARARFTLCTLGDACGTVSCKAERERMGHPEYWLFTSFDTGRHTKSPHSLKKTNYNSPDSCEVHALHSGRCSPQSACWHFREQYQILLHPEHRLPPPPPPMVSKQLAQRARAWSSESTALSGWTAMI